MTTPSDSNFPNPQDGTNGPDRAAPSNPNGPAYGQQPGASEGQQTWGSQPGPAQPSWNQPNQQQPQQWGAQQQPPQQWGGQQQPQWGAQAQQPQQPQPQQWGAQQQPQQPQQWGGEPQWGAQQQPPQQWGGQQQPQWGAQAQQPQQPQQPQWGAQQPQQQWGQGAPAAAPAPRAPMKLPEWPTWVYTVQLLLTFITSFMSVLNIGGGIDGVGRVAFSVNWWGRLSLQHSGYGRYADNFFTEEMMREANAEFSSALMIVAALLILALYAAAVFFSVVKNWKLAAALGTAAGALQLLSVIIAAFQTEEGVNFGAGWWLWLLISLVTLAVSILLLVKGKDAVTAQLNKARTAATSNTQQGGAPNYPATSQQGQAQWSQPQQQAQQQPQSGSTAWTPPTEQQGARNGAADTRPRTDYGADSGNDDAGSSKPE